MIIHRGVCFISPRSRILVKRMATPYNHRLFINALSEKEDSYNVAIQAHAAVFPVLYPQLLVGLAQVRTAIHDTCVLRRCGEQLALQPLLLAHLAARHGIAAHILPPVAHIVHHIPHAPVQLHLCACPFAALHGQSLDIDNHYCWCLRCLRSATCPAPRRHRKGTHTKRVGLKVQPNPTLIQLYPPLSPKNGVFSSNRILLRPIGRVQQTGTCRRNGCRR